MAEASNGADELLIQPSEYSPEEDAQENRVGVLVTGSALAGAIRGGLIPLAWWRRQLARPSDSPDMKAEDTD